MARRIVEAGFPLTLWARRSQSIEPFQDTSMTVATSPADLGAQSDLVGVCVVGDAGVEDVLLGSDGVLTGMAPGGIVAIHSTIHPDTCRSIAVRAADGEISVIDAPVSGGGGAAANRTLLVMAGGDFEAVELCRPVFETFGNPVVHLGPLGSGQMAKLINNLVFTAQISMALDTFSFVERLGLDQVALGNVLSHGSGGSRAIEILSASGVNLNGLRSHASLLNKNCFSAPLCEHSKCSTTRGTERPMRFEGKTVIITGGGAGIGQRYAHRFANENANVVIAELNPAAGDRVVAEVEALGHSCLSRQMDVTDEGAVLAMVEAAADHFGSIDILINNAGIHLEHAQLPFTIEAAAKWRTLLDVNVIGALICSAACRPHMAAQGGGSIINHSSMAAYMGGGAYGVSKLALNALTVGMASDFGPDNIRVNGIAPGFVDSESALTFLNTPERAGLEQRLVGGQIIKRLGRMDDLADMALFLCSDEASFVTGQTILVDGGAVKKPF
jgi:NAD(P)-dependent dehydrogenase (short-subunit alcohol dehydrogenase family)/3-hydroxyisobutyrate dehydrogenase-like beta-hydroxyacid dehydrogenase